MLRKMAIFVIGLRFFAEEKPGMPHGNQKTLKSEDRQPNESFLMPQEAKTIDFEVLPPEAPTGKTAHSLPRLIAFLMDDLFRLPGTNRRLGLNPLLDLIPGIGDASAATISAVTLFAAMRYRVPKIVIARMGVNILLNAIIGVIPGVGEAFAFWFRPSRRNYELLKKHAGSEIRPSTTGDKIFVFAIIALILLSFVALIFVGLFVMSALARALFPGRPA